MYTEFRFVIGFTPVFEIKIGSRHIKEEPFTRFGSQFNWKGWTDFALDAEWTRKFFGGDLLPSVLLFQLDLFSSLLQDWNKLHRWIRDLLVPYVSSYLNPTVWGHTGTKDSWIPEAFYTVCISTYNTCTNLTACSVRGNPHKNLE